MHGRLRVKTTKEQEEEQRAKEREKAFYFKDLKTKIFELRPTIGEAQDLSQYFKLTTELLLINPDFYTIWNIRKQLISASIEKQPESSEELCKNELIFTLDCLKKNEKSYSVWQHRIWCLAKMPESPYEGELHLCNSFLMKDERNFHCWDYRSYISDLANRSLESELDFTTEKIRSNFSNFSAWHRRHKLFLRGLQLPAGECPESCDLRLVWKREYDMILNALFTDPSDQSPWLYHNWLVKNNFGHLGSYQVDTLVQLQDMEPTNRWVQQAIKQCHEVMNKSS